jgi:long-chain acyl-CoA synthetase
VTGRRYRYAEMRQLCRRFAASLRRAGLQPGDTLNIVMPNTAEWPIVLLGAVEAGLLVTTTNPQYTRGKYSNTACSTVGRYRKLLLELTVRKFGAQV